MPGNDYRNTPGAMLAVLGAFMLVLIGCHPLHRTLTNRDYGPKGYKIDSPYGTFEYKKSSDNRTLKIGEGYNHRTYTDKDGDGKVDHIKYADKAFTRGEEGTEKMFQKADREWKNYMESFDVKEVHKRWSNMSPEERHKQASHFR